MLTESTEHHSLLSPGLLAELKRLELRSRRRISGDLSGSWRSAFRGMGLTFADLREYQPGDEVRSIDWKASARSPHIFVKSYEEDRQLNIILALDISSSTAFGRRSKHHKALEFAALLSLLAARNKDRIGLCLFSDQVEEFYPASQKRSQTQRLLSALLTKRKLRPATAIAPALEYLKKHQRKSSIIFLVSDFYAPPFEKELRELCFRHEVILVELCDEFDEALPNAGIVEFEAAEGGERVLIDTSRPGALLELKRHNQQRRAKLASLCEGGCDLISIDRDPLSPLAALMHRRTARQR